ncbi:MAG: imidazole glycerol phosphate synthase subunit HisH [Candidatus Omnitrophota bacterium]|jgi:glutamine amidotransferase
MIIVIDYGMGNLHSVRKALEVVGAKAKVSSRAEDILKADKIVFPGVGSFGEAMKELNKRKLVKPIKDAINVGKPFLGLCLGLQLLFERSEESPGVRGLGLLKGAVKRFKFAGRRSFKRSCLSRSQDQICAANLKVPHMGWNNIVNSSKLKVRSSKILKNVPDNSCMYFVHSYYVKPVDKKVVLTTTSYGIDFASGVCKDNIYAFQFHPEKSQELGLKILKNFVRL